MAADSLPKKFGDYVQAAGPVAFIAPRPHDDVLKVMRNGIEKTRVEVEGKTAKRVFPVLEEAQMCVYNRKECKTETRQVIILNICESRKILPRTCALPALRMQTNPITELSVAIL